MNSEIKPKLYKTPGRPTIYTTEEERKKEIKRKKREYYLKHKEELNARIRTRYMLQTENHEYKNHSKYSPIDKEPNDQKL